MIPQESYPESFNQFRHEVKTPLTAIYGRAQLLARAVSRSTSMTEEEQARLIDGLAMIAAEVKTAVMVVDGLRPPASDRWRDSPHRTHVDRLSDSRRGDSSWTAGSGHNHPH